MIFDDTDIWSVADDAMAARARDFFAALRTLQDCRGLRLLVSVQTHWTETTPGASAPTRAAQREYQELAERVETRLTVPQPRSMLEGETLITAIINRRIQLALEHVSEPAEGWAATLFSAQPRKVLGSRCINRNIRIAINDIRDVFDHLDQMPDQINEEHLLTVIDQ